MMFFPPEFSIDTRKLRKSFNAVKQALRVKGVRYSMLFPRPPPGWRDCFANEVAGSTSPSSQ